MVQECEGGLQPAAQTGKQTGATSQTWRPGKSQGRKRNAVKQKPEGTQQKGATHTWPKDGAVSGSAA